MTTSPIGAWQARTSVRCTFGGRPRRTRGLRRSRRTRVRRGTRTRGRRFGVGESFLYKFKDKLGLPPRDRTYHYDEDDPTEAEIAERAAAIRASWPDGEEEKRFVGRRREEWSLPSFRFSRRDAAIIPAEQL